MQDIKIVTDTSADLSDELIEKYDIGIVRFLTIFGDKTYENGTDITNTQFYDMLEKTDIIPKSSQPPYQTLYDFLLKESREHKTVIFFTISSVASGEYQTANMIKNDIIETDNKNADIRIVDSYSFSIFIAATVVRAAEMVKAGKTADEIIDVCEYFLLSWRCYLLVDTLKYLEKGGRLSKTAAFVGSLLDIKPILTIENGLVESYDKIRGNKRTFDKVIDKIEENPEFINCRTKEFMVIQSGEEKGAEACEKLRAKYGDDCIKMYLEFGPLIGIHVGRNAVAILARIKD